MPLINLRTDLKSLKYGKDTPGGGYSGQPYIQAKIPDGLEPKSPDFLLRNGYLAPVDALTDIKRLAKMFGDLKSPNGLLFIAKQNILSNSAVRTQTSRVVNEGVYTPLSTLAQAGVVAFGGHLNKQGINPFRETGAYAEGDYLYFNKVKPNPNDSQQASNEKNRLVSLYTAINDNIAINNWNFSGVNLNVGDNNILSYRGGPGSTLGVGNTNIRFADQRTGKNNPLKVSSPNYFNGKNQQKTININNQQVGGLQVNTGNGTKSWIKGGVYFDGNAKNIYYANDFDKDNFPNGLPSNNVNTPQILSLSNIPDGSLTWTPPQNNPDSLKYYTNISNTGVTGKYFRLTDKELKNPYNELGQSKAWNWFNVYDPNTTPGNTWPDNTPLIYANNTATYSQKDINNETEIEPNAGKKTGAPKIYDFRRILRINLRNQANNSVQESAKRLGQTPDTTAYTDKYYEKRVNIGGSQTFGPGNSTGKNLVSYTSGSGIGPIDKINALPIYRSENVAQNSDDYPVNDLVKFRIAAIDGSNPNFKTFMHFRAFIDSFNDSYNANWGSVKYLGRGENFYNYQGFDRTISLSFTVAAQSKPELIPMYKKLNYLASNLTPDYSPYGYMRGPLVQLTVGGYLYEQVGFISSLTYDIPNDTPWEIGINDSGNSDPTVKELPHRINVSSFNFTPIHNFVPGKQGLEFGSNNTGFVSTYGKQRYIALSNGAIENYNDTSGMANTAVGGSTPPSTQN